MRYILKPLFKIFDLYAKLAYIKPYLLQIITIRRPLKIAQGKSVQLAFYFLSIYRCHTCAFIHNYNKKTFPYSQKFVKNCTYFLSGSLIS